METKIEPIAFYDGWVLGSSSKLPDDYNCLLLHKIIQQVDKWSLLGRWLYWSEIAELAYRQNVLPKSRMRLLQRALAYPFDMLDQGQPLILGEYQVEPHLPNQDQGWYKITLHEPNARLFRADSNRAQEECV